MAEPQSVCLTNRIRRIRTQRVFVDSRDHAPHRNNNPWQYQFSLGKILPNVVGVKLLSINMTYSPTFIVTRVSPWMPSGTALSAMSALHQKAVAMETAINAAEEGKTTRYATITNTNSSDTFTNLQVNEVYTYQVSRDSDSAIRTYSVFVCTGTYTSIDLTEYLTLTDLLDEESYVLYQNDAGYTGDTEAPYDVTDAVYLVRKQDESVILYLGTNQGDPRLLNAKSALPEWESGRVYRRGTVLARNGQGNRYVCITTHASRIFADDLASGLWTVQTDLKMLQGGRFVGPAHGAFYVLEPTAQTQQRIQLNFTPGAISVDMPPTTLDHIDLEWRTRSKAPYMFPHGVFENDLEPDVDADPDNRLRERLYTPHSITIELTYEEDSEVVDRGQQSISAAPRFTLPTAPYGNPSNGGVRRLPGRRL